MENLINEELLIAIKQITKKFRENVDKHLEKFGLTGQQGRILFFIKRNIEQGTNIRQVDIEKRFYLSKSTVSGLIQRMIKNELIIKRKIKTKICLIPTLKGDNVIEEIKKARLKSMEKLLTGFNEKEKETMFNQIKQIQRNIEEASDNVEENS